MSRQGKIFFGAIAAFLVLMAIANQTVFDGVQGGGASTENSAGSFDGERFIAEVESWDGVLDAAVSNDGRIYVAMYDNGSSRDGYAMTVCEEARAHAEGPVEDMRITILDAVASSNDDFAALGKHRCRF